MLIEFTNQNGVPLYINPRFVIAVIEEKHFGRPGVAADSGYRDTLIMTTKGDFNVQEAPENVAASVNQALAEDARLSAGTAGE